MSIDSVLLERAQHQCELCSSPDALNAYLVPPKVADEPQNQVVLCSICLKGIDQPKEIDENHWRALNESIWNPEPAVQVLAYRVLDSMNDKSWVQDLLGMIYLEDSTLEWAENQAGRAVIHKDSNGHVLEAGDTVTLIQDLNVKGANFTAKRGTAVRRIRLVSDNPEHIEGKVDGQMIVILTKYVKKQS